MEVKQDDDLEQHQGNNDDDGDDEQDVEAESLMSESSHQFAPKTINSAIGQLASEFGISRQGWAWIPQQLGSRFKYPLMLLLFAGLMMAACDWANLHVDFYIGESKSTTPTSTEPQSSKKNPQSTNTNTTNNDASATALAPTSPTPTALPPVSQAPSLSTAPPTLPTPVDPSMLPHYKINDATVTLDPIIDHPWVRYHLDPKNTSFEKPKVRLVLTDFGWNHPDATKGLSYSRCKRSRELLQGYIDHPHFDPTFQWTHHLDHRDNIDTDPEVQTIVLMDLESCFESNYPSYTGGGPNANSDLMGGRAYEAVPDDRPPCWFYEDCFPYIQQVLESPIMLAEGGSNDGHMIYIDCAGHWKWDERYPMTVRHVNLTTPQLSFVSQSVTYQKIREDSDMGLPPPAVHPIKLETDEINDIRTCQSEDPNHRYFYFSFIGHDRKDDSPRVELFRLSNDRDILLMETEAFNQKYHGGHTFDAVTRRSRFSATPRGDCLFSYRFHEVLSAGAIPVVHADGWVLGFRKELVDWTKCAVVIPEKDIPKTLDILRNITEEKRCEMRQYCWDIYTKYLSTPSGTVVGIVDSVLAMKAQKALDAK